MCNKKYINENKIIHIFKLIYILKFAKLEKNLVQNVLS